MIKDRIENIKLYEKLSVNLGNAIQCIGQENFLDELSIKGRMEGDGFYVMLQEYETKPDEEGRWETHKKYIDIQYVLSGQEKTGYTNIGNLGEILESNQENDFYFYGEEACADWVTVHGGDFVIFFPTDGHKPSLNVNNMVSKVKKVVFKVEV